MTSNNGSYKKGEIYLVQEYDTSGSEQKKNRPWILVGASPINKARKVVVAIPLSTSAIESNPITVKIYFNNIIQCAVLDQIRALDKKRFIRFEGALDQHDIDLIDDNLRKVLAL